MTKRFVIADVTTSAKGNLVAKLVSKTAGLVVATMWLICDETAAVGSEIELDVERSDDGYWRVI